MTKNIAPYPADAIIVGDNSYTKYHELPVEGRYNTIKTIVIPEDEWLQLPSNFTTQIRLQEEK